MPRGAHANVLVGVVQVDAGLVDRIDAAIEDVHACRVDGLRTIGPDVHPDREATADEFDRIGVAGGASAGVVESSGVLDLG